MVGSLKYIRYVLILDETRINIFHISLSHPCLYGRGNIEVLEGVVELRMMPLLA